MMEFKDRLGQDLAPGDNIKYYSKGLQEWRPAKIIEFIWGEKGFRCKIEYNNGYYPTRTAIRSLKDVLKVT